MEYFIVAAAVAAAALWLYEDGWQGAESVLQARFEQQRDDIVGN